MKPKPVSPQSTVTGRRESQPAPPHRLVGKHPALAMPYGGKLQDQVNQLRNIDYALIERRFMALQR